MKQSGETRKINGCSWARAARREVRPEQVLRAMQPLHDDRPWSSEGDTLAMLYRWQDGHPLVLEGWAGRQTLSLQRFANQPRESRRGFLERWRNGLRRSLALVAALFMLCLAGASADPKLTLSQGAPAEVFAKANDAYNRGNWEEAAAGYRALAAQGVDDAAVWYDLGNTYAHMDDLGRARACYERALRLSPRDRDTRANLAVLQQKLTDKEADDDGLANLSQWYTLNELSVASSLLWFSTAILFALWLRGRRERTAWLAVLSLAALLAVGALFAQRWHAEAGLAVIIPGEVKLYNGPGPDYTGSITLHAGARVQVLRAEGDWREIGALKSVRGWVRAEQLEPI